MTEQLTLHFTSPLLYWFGNQKAFFLAKNVLLATSISASPLLITYTVLLNFMSTYNPLEVLSGGPVLKNPPAMQEMHIQSLDWEDPLEKEKVTHSSILAWRIPWTVQFMGLQKVGHDWATCTSLHFWLKTSPSNIRHEGSIPGRGSGIPHALKPKRPH